MFHWIVANYIEIIASVLGIMGVYLTIRQSIWCWPVGLINVILSLIVFFTSKLYADVVLQIFYVAMTLYGWWNWIYGGEKKFELPIRNIFRSELIFMLIIGFTSSALVGYMFANFTDASYPYWDSMLMVWGIIATYAMAKKIIEHWIMWIIIDLNCTILYFCKSLYAFAPLYFIFTILAFYGYKKWEENLKS